MPIIDDSLISQYVRAIENPDSIGYRDGKWYKSGLQGHDANNRGFGIDVVENKDARALTQGRKGQWLSEDEERRLRLKHLDYINEALDKNTPWSILRNQPSEEAKAMALGMLYRGDSVMQNPKVREAYLSGSDEKMKKAVSDYYTNENPHKERAANHNKFFSTKRNVETRAEEDPYKYIRKQELWKPKSFAEYQYKPNAKFSEGGSLDNYWNSLSMKDKAEMIKVAIGNGITTLPEIREAYNKFAKGGRMKGWTMEDEAGYRYWRSRLPKNLRDTNDSDYDMRAAYKTGMQPEWSEEDKSYHLGTRDPQSGRILKSPHHPTFLKGLLADASLGYYSTMDSKGNIYTETWPGNTLYEKEGIDVPFKAYGGNLFGAGGKKDSRGSNAERTMSYLMGRGMSNIGAAAIVGTLQAESGLDPTIHAKMKGDTGEGLAQWTGSRKKNFWSTLETIEPGAKRRYGSIDRVPFERQLDVVLAERPDVTAAIHSAKDIDTATDIMLRGYENGGGTLDSLASKAQMDKIYGKWNNGYNNQMKNRLGNANRLLGLKVSPSSYQISQGFFDDINAQINSVSPASLQSAFDIDPELRYKPVKIDETMFQQPEQKNPVEETYNPMQEKIEGFRNMSKVMGLMGMQNPLGYDYGSSSNNTPGLLSMIGSIYG